MAIHLHVWPATSSPAHTASPLRRQFAQLYLICLYSGLSGPTGANDRRTGVTKSMKKPIKRTLFHLTNPPSNIGTKFTKISQIRNCKVPTPAPPLLAPKIQRLIGLHLLNIYPSALLRPPPCSIQKAYNGLTGKQIPLLFSHAPCAFCSQREASSTFAIARYQLEAKPA